jgi:CRISPR/Cas system-associated protein endoribonuclease Cas2
MKNGYQKFLILVSCFGFFLVYFSINSRGIKNDFPQKASIQNLNTAKVFEFKIDKNNLKKILKILKGYDYKNAPKREIINGRLIYKYKRLENEPKKTLEELKLLIDNPEQTKNEEKFIKKAMLSLLSSGVKIYIKDMKEDFSAQWVFKERRIIFNKSSLKEGTKNFANLLSHEMIHVSQSCKSGSFNSYPALLNLDLEKPIDYYYKYLKSNAYKDLKENELMLEIEAYANEKKHTQTLNLYNYFCLRN